MSEHNGKPKSLDLHAELPSREELRHALARARDGFFADMMATWLSVAIETHPEVIRGILAQVFGLKFLEQDARKILSVAQEARSAAYAARQQVAALSADLERLRAEIDALRYAQETPNPEY